MDKIALLKVSGCGVTDFIMQEGTRDFCDICFALCGILIVLGLVYFKKSLCKSKPL